VLVSAKVPKKKLHSPFCSETFHVCRLYITPSNINLPLQHTFLISVSHPERTATDQPTSTQTTSAVRTPRSYTPAGGFLLHHSPHVQDVEGAAVSGSRSSVCSRVLVLEISFLFVRWQPSVRNCRVGGIQDNGRRAQNLPDFDYVIHRRRCCVHAHASEFTVTHRHAHMHTDTVTDKTFSQHGTCIHSVTYQPISAVLAHLHNTSFDLGS